VFSLMGHKVLDEAAAAGTELDADLASKATAEFDKAEAKIKQAMEVKPGFFEVLLQLAGKAQQHVQQPAYTALVSCNQRCTAELRRTDVTQAGLAGCRPQL
jgi:hypothetical protein